MTCCACWTLQRQLVGGSCSPQWWAGPAGPTVGGSSTGLPPSTHRCGRTSCAPVPCVPDTGGAGAGGSSMPTRHLPNIQEAAQSLIHTLCSTVQEGWAAPQPGWQWREEWAGNGSKAWLVGGHCWHVAYLLPASLRGRAHYPSTELPRHRGSAGRHAPPSM